MWGDADRRRIVNGKLTPVGNTVDVATASWTNTIGDPELVTVWKDQISIRRCAFYYARVLEFPRRWTAYDAAYFKMKIPDPKVPMTTQERAFTSPIWYTVIRRLLREPLLHFALLGAAIFGAYRLIAPPVSDASEIVITADRIASITAQFSASHGGRPPHEEELRAAVDAYVRDEMLYREASPWVSIGTIPSSMPDSAEG